MFYKLFAMQLKPFIYLYFVAVLFYNVIVNCTVYVRFTFRSGALWTYRGHYTIIIFDIYKIGNLISLEREIMASVILLALAKCIKQCVLVTFFFSFHYVNAVFRCQFFFY